MKPRCEPRRSRRGEVVAQGTGPLSFRAPDRGLVSVYDVATNTVIHSSGVTTGSILTVNTNTGGITISEPGGGTQNVYQGLNKSHRYEIWFIPAQGGTLMPGRPAGSFSSSIGYKPAKRGSISRRLSWWRRWVTSNSRSTLDRS